ncbi:MAG: alpha/beta hydrolase fold domain-containing protein [Nocardioides sp.]
MSTPSLRLRATTALLAAVPDALVTHAFTHPPRRRRRALVPRAITHRHDVTETKVGIGRLATVAPRGSTSQGHLVFLHGGAYALQDLHWPFLKLLLNRGWTVSLVDYPLLPEHTVDDTVPMVVAAWEHLLAAHPGEGLCLAGDSAGGGLALVLLQRLRDLGRPLPSATVLLSPWVDLVLEDPATRALSRRDVVLPLTGLSRAARLYAGDRDLADPWLSPINGRLHDLGRIQAWVGTAEMFLPQCRLLADRAAAAVGTELELHLAHKLPHDWVLFPVPERGLLVEEMLTFLAGT